MERVPVKSYHKSTVAKLYDNEGEVNWTVPMLIRRLKQHKKLYKKLLELGYYHKNRDFTSNQVELIFKHLSHPILNSKNRVLLKLPIKKRNNKLLELLFTLIRKDSKAMGFKGLNKLSDKALASLGVIKNENSVFDCYIIEYNEKYCFKKQKDSLKLFLLTDNKEVKTINSTQELIMELMKLKNE